MEQKFDELTKKMIDAKYGTASDFLGELLDSEGMDYYDYYTDIYDEIEDYCDFDLEEAKPSDLLDCYVKYEGDTFEDIKDRILEDAESIVQLAVDEDTAKFLESKGGIEGFEEYVKDFLNTNYEVEYEGIVNIKFGDKTIATGIYDEEFCRFYLHNDSIYLSCIDGDVEVADYSDLYEDELMEYCLENGISDVIDDESRENCYGELVERFADDIIDEIEEYEVRSEMECINNTDEVFNIVQYIDVENTDGIWEKIKSMNKEEFDNFARRNNLEICFNSIGGKSPSEREGMRADNLI